MYRIIGADGREYGPISANQLRQWIAERRANAATRVLVEGSTDWKTLGSLSEFSALFATTPSFSPTTVFVPKTNGFAVTGMILGILSVVFGLSCCLFCCYGMPFNILGLIFSVIGLIQISNNPQRYSGKGMAITGIVLSLISLFISLILLIVIGAGSGWDQVKHHGYRL